MFFFFSSRRRHTRCGRDWSSDVCSSDLYAQGLTASRELVGELEAVAGLVIRQAKAANNWNPRTLQSRLNPSTRLSVQNLEGDTILSKDLNILADRVELLLLAEKLQQAAGVLIIGNALFLAQRPQYVAAVLGDPDHAPLVQGIARAGAVTQHGRHPPPCLQIYPGADDQRRVLHEHPLDRLLRDARRCPGGRIARRDLAGVREAGFQRRATLTV